MGLHTFTMKHGSSRSIKRSPLYSRQYFSALLYHCETVFLFTKSDFKTTVIPVSIFALGTSPSRGTSYSLLLQSFLWIWLITLQFNIFNQYYGVEEDRKNKSWRPLPSGRINIETASMLRYLVTFVVGCISWTYSRHVFAASMSFSVLIFMYHLLHGDSNWIMKNVLNGAGYACIAWGSALVASNDRSALDPERMFGLSMLVAVIITTIQAQDFQDRDGDRLAGRITMSMIWPVASRYTLCFILLAWSALLGNYWLPSTMFSLFMLWLVYSLVEGIAYEGLAKKMNGLTSSTTCGLQLHSPYQHTVSTKS
ncbi:UbiA prenyltransferase family-domain-containing protein [Cyathus striatus]|nr:UbiA prenyltransferase family-domain-containing protein [Cyathus striatus]